MERFTLEKYLQDPTRKVVTRDGRDVRIICTDAKSELPVVALVNDGDKEATYQYYTNGLFPIILSCDLNLFFAPLKQSRWVYLYKSSTGNVCSSMAYTTKEEAISNMTDDDCFALTEITWEE